jgi:hypothetical protein
MALRGSSRRFFFEGRTDKVGDEQVNVSLTVEAA